MSSAPSTSRPVVIAGPSGVGKSTLITRLRSNFPNSFGFSVSHTTRGPRPSEEDGVHYHFVTDAQFDEIKNAGGFLENAQFASNRYGTSKEALKQVQSSGRVCLLDIDLQGVLQFKENDAGLGPVYIFLTPPSMEELKRRLVGRGDTAPEAVEKRLNRAAEEIAASTQEGLFDFIIVSNDPDTTYTEFEKAVLGANPSFHHT